MTVTGHGGFGRWRRDAPRHNGRMDASSGRDALERRLREQLDDEGLQRGALPSFRYRLERLSVDRYLAAQGGPLPYMRRLRQIETEEADHLRALAEARERLARAAGSDAAAFAAAWTRLVARWDFGGTNELIDAHNDCYPMEANLPMDPRTGDFVLVAGRSYRRPRLDAGWVLERLPAVLATAA